MTNTQHTPGPWHIGAITSEGHNVQIRAKKGNTTFECCPAILGGWDTSKEENLANARLIAAAPELLEVLHQVIAELAGSADAMKSLNAIRMCESAIAKAKGE